MFDKIRVFALHHPIAVDLEQTPRCFITNREFPNHLARPKPFPGHMEVWELAIPLISWEDVIEIDSNGRVFFYGPYIKFCFFADEWHKVDKDEFQEWVLEVKEHALLERVPEMKGESSMAS